MAHDPAHSRLHAMTTLRARVIQGRIHLDEPTNLPDGTELELRVVVEQAEETLTPEEEKGLIEALESVRAGRGIDGASARERLLARARR